MMPHRGAFPSFCPLELPRPGCVPDLSDATLPLLATEAMGETVCCDPHFHFCGGQCPVNTSYDRDPSLLKPRLRDFTHGS